MTKVSITMATYHGAEYLKKISIPSILNQTLQDWNLHIVGEGTTPDTEDVVHSFNDPRITYFNMIRPDYSKVCNNPEDRTKGGQFWNIGGVFALNESLKFCQGEYIAHVDQDDYWTPTHLEKMVQKLDSDDSKHFVYSSVVRFYQDKYIDTYDQDVDTHYLLNTGNYIFHSSVMYRASKFGHLSYSTDSSIPTDYNLFRSMAKLEPNGFCHLKDKTTFYLERCGVGFCENIINNKEQFIK